MREIHTRIDGFSRIDGYDAKREARKKAIHTILLVILTAVAVFMYAYMWGSNHDTHLFYSYYGDGSIESITRFENVEATIWRSLFFSSVSVFISKPIIKKILAEKS